MTDERGVVRFERLSPQAPDCDQNGVWGLGYFVSDPRDHRAGAMVLNRSTTLRDAARLR